jgi:hypothetical protein
MMVVGKKESGALNVRRRVWSKAMLKFIYASGGRWRSGRGPLNRPRTSRFFPLPHRLQRPTPTDVVAHHPRYTAQMLFY